MILKNRKFKRLSIKKKKKKQKKKNKKKTISLKNVSLCLVYELLYVKSMNSFEEKE